MKTASFGKLLCKEKGFKDEKQVVGKAEDRIQHTEFRRAEPRSELVWGSKLEEELGICS